MFHLLPVKLMFSTALHKVHKEKISSMNSCTPSVVDFFFNCFYYYNLLAWHPKNLLSVLNKASLKLWIGCTPLFVDLDTALTANLLNTN